MSLLFVLVSAFLAAFTILKTVMGNLRSKVLSSTALLLYCSQAAKSSVPPDPDALHRK